MRAPKCICGGKWVKKKLPERLSCGRKPALSHITICNKCGDRPADYATQIYNSAEENFRQVKRLRKLNMSNYEIAKALGIPEDAPVLK